MITAVHRRLGDLASLVSVQGSDAMNFPVSSLNRFKSSSNKS